MITLFKSQGYLAKHECFTNQGLKLTKKSSRNFTTRYKNLVAISQNLVTKPSRCIVLSAV